MYQPKSGHFRKSNRFHLCNTYENKSSHLSFGTHGIQAIEKGYLTVNQIEAVRRTLSTRLKRKGKLWIRAYPHSSCTAKPQEVRIGRGKGNVSYWYSTVKPGRILFEAKISRRYTSLLMSTLQFALRKLPIYAQIITLLFTVLMKKNTHPFTFNTFIRQKDGSSFSKNWIYFRQLLILEIDQKVWDTVKYKKKKDTNQKQYNNNDTLSIKNTIVYKQKFNFWI